MKKIRWYDENPDLKEAFEFIKGLDSQAQKSIAQDILQSLMGDFGLNLDEQINTITKNYNPKYDRWYDQNVDLFMSFELIKKMSPQLQQQVIKKINTSILFIYLSEVAK